MLVEYGIAPSENQVAAASGTIQASMALTTAAIMLWWAHMSTAYGRKSVLIASTTACAVVSSTVGLA